MKFGILLCDTVLEEFAEHGQYPERFVNLLKDLGPNVIFSVFDAQHGVLPVHIDDADVYLITGSKQGVNDGLPWVDALVKFVRQAHQRKKE